MMYGWYGDGGGIFTWIVMTLIMLVFWGGVIATVVLLVRSSRANNAAPSLHPSHHDAERVLNERFARGEIDETEYIARRTALRRPE